MKKIIFTLIAMVTMLTQASAMSYEQARREALFLTDKMAYELNLTDAQYEAAYENNLDYLMSVTGRHDVFGTYWDRRNADLNYILYSWQWDVYRAATYFFRPLYWDAGYWHFGVYARYPYRDYYYFGRPHFYATYRGGHSWHYNGGRSYYAHHHGHYRPQIHRDHHRGMRDGWNRGDYRSHGHGNSSTRVTGGSHGRITAGTHNHGLFRGDGNSMDNRHQGNAGGTQGNNGGSSHGSGSMGSGTGHGNNHGGTTGGGRQTVGRYTSNSGSATLRNERSRSANFGSSRSVSARSANDSYSSRHSVSRGSTSFAGAVSRGSSASFSSSRGSSASFSSSRGSSAGFSSSRGSSSVRSSGSASPARSGDRSSGRR